MRLFSKKTVALGLGAAALVVASSTGTALAGNLIGSKDIKDGGVHKIDLGKGVQAKLAKVNAPRIGNVTTGANYTNTWAGDGGAQLHTIVNKCAPGQVAVGGGFSTWGGSDVNESGLAYDLGGDNKDIQVTVSAPYTGEAYDPDKYNGDIRPDRWVVKGYNNGSADQIVRAWVVCADAS